MKQLKTEEEILKHMVYSGVSCQTIACTVKCKNHKLPKRPRNKVPCPFSLPNVDCYIMTNIMLNNNISGQIRPYVIKTAKKRLEEIRKLKYLEEL
jgi:hypothetical protein